MGADEYRGLTAADVMLRAPKTLPSSVRVRDVRALLRNPSVQMVLLADDGVFQGAVTHLPDGALDEHDALSYAERHPESITPTAPAEKAFEVTARSAFRRVVVLDEQSALVGLLCLNESRTRFCGGVRRNATA